MTKRISPEFYSSPSSLIHAEAKPSHPVLFRLSNINNLALRTAGIGLHFKHMLLLTAGALLTKQRLRFSVFPTFALNQNG